MPSARLASQDRDLLNAYLREMGRHPMLDRAQEHAIAVEYQRTRNPRLAGRLVTANLRLVVKIANEYRRHKASLLDLVQEGNLGLLEAVQRYDPHRGVRLPSYATWWIKAYILKYLMDTARLVRTGRTRSQRQAFFKGQLPPPDLSLADAFRDEEVGGAVDAWGETEGLRPDLAVELKEAERFVHAQLRAFGEALDERESLVFSERVLAPEPSPLREIGLKLSMTGERVRQIEKNLVARFRTFVGESAAAA